jgi:hypothetical protein
MNTLLLVGILCVLDPVAPVAACSNAPAPVIDEILPPPGSNSIAIDASPNGVSYLVVTGSGFTEDSTVSVLLIDSDLTFTAEVVDWSEDQLLVRVITDPYLGEHLQPSTADKTGLEDISITVTNGLVTSVPVVTEALVDIP